MTRAAIAAVLLLALFSAKTWSQDFDGFRIPDSRTIAWTGFAGGSLMRNRLSGSGRAVKSGASSGTLQSTFSVVHDSDPARSAWVLSISGGGARAYSDTRFDQPDFLGFWGSREADDQSVSQLFVASVEDRRYPWVVPLGWSASLDASASFGESWRQESSVSFRNVSGTAQSYRTRYSLDDVAENRSVSGRLVLGWGRVRDATSVMDAWTLERRLEASGALQRPLTRAARERLAALLSLRGAYSAVLDRSGRSVWREIERLIEEDGALSEGGVTAFGTLRAGEPVFPGTAVAQDVLPRSPVQRSIGYFVGPEVEWSHNLSWQSRGAAQTSVYAIGDSVTGTGQSESRYGDQYGSDQVLGGIRIEYHRPLSERLQLDVMGRIARPLHKEGRGHAVSSSARLDWLVLDRWLIGGSVMQSGTAGTGDVEGWRVTYGGSARYFIEDRLGVGLSLSEIQEERYGFGGNPEHMHRRDARVNLTLDYQFLGRIAAPGLITPLETPLGGFPR